MSGAKPSAAAEGFVVCGSGVGIACSGCAFARWRSRWSALHAAAARSRGGAPFGRGWAVAEDAGEQQIPFGNDKQEKQRQMQRQRRD